LWLRRSHLAASPKVDYGSSSTRQVSGPPQHAEQTQTNRAGNPQATARAGQEFDKAISKCGLKSTPAKAFRTLLDHCVAAPTADPSRIADPYSNAFLPATAFSLRIGCPHRCADPCPNVCRHRSACRRRSLMRPPLFLQDTLRPNKLGGSPANRICREARGAADAKIAPKRFKIHGRTKKDQEALALQHTILVNRLGRDVVA
jgi:hypothetical protein